MGRYGQIWADIGRYREDIEGARAACSRRVVDEVARGASSTSSTQQYQGTSVVTRASSRPYSVAKRAQRGSRLRRCRRTVAASGRRPYL